MILTASVYAEAAKSSCTPWVNVDVMVRSSAAAKVELYLMLVSHHRADGIGAHIPVRVDRWPGHGPVRVHVSDVPPSRMGPCCENDPHGEVVLPFLPVGEQVLELHHDRRVDRYRIVISDTEVTFAPISTCFSDGGEVRPRRRIPTGAFSVACYQPIAVPDGGVACAGLYAEPWLQTLPRLLPSAGGWAHRGLERDTPVFASGDLAVLRRLLIEHYPAARSALRIVVTPSGAPAFGN